MTPRTITSTAGDSLNFVGNFDKVEKWKRYDYKENSDEAHDKYDPYTTKYRYAINDIKNLGKSPGHVIPTPLQITVYDNETISLETRDWVVVYPDELLNEADYLTSKWSVLLFTSRKFSALSGVLCCFFQLTFFLHTLFILVPPPILFATFFK